MARYMSRVGHITRSSNLFFKKKTYIHTLYHTLLQPRPVCRLVHSPVPGPGHQPAAAAAQPADVLAAALVGHRHIDGLQRLKLSALPPRNLPAVDAGVQCKTDRPSAIRLDVVVQLQLLQLNE